MTEPLNKRQRAKAATRERVLAAARCLWAEPGSYERGTIREIATAAGMSTGAVFANFKNKADLWAVALGTEHRAGDSVLSRAAPSMFQALQDLIEVRPEIAESEDPTAALTWRRAEDLLERIKAQLLDEQTALAEAEASADVDAAQAMAA